MMSHGVSWCRLMYSHGVSCCLMMLSLGVLCCLMESDGVLRLMESHGVL